MKKKKKSWDEITAWKAAKVKTGRKRGRGFPRVSVTVNCKGCLKSQKAEYVLKEVLKKTLLRYFIKGKKTNTKSNILQKTHTTTTLSFPGWPSGEADWATRRPPCCRWWERWRSRRRRTGQEGSGSGADCGSAWTPSDCRTRSPYPSAEDPEWCPSPIKPTDTTHRCVISWI